jgi:hypothetical protein
MSAALPTQLPGTTIYYRVRAINSVGPSIPGDTFSFPTLNPPPIASAGDNQSVFSGKTVTLDGSGSSDGYGGTLTYQWTQTAGTSVTLSSSTSQKPNFTAPPVSFPSPSELLTFSLKVTSSRGPFATSNVNVTVKYGFLDDFSTNTTGFYTVSQTLGSGSTFTRDPDVGSGGAAFVQTGAANALKFQRAFGFADDGTFVGNRAFSLIFYPTDVHGAGNGIIIRMGEVDAGAYFEINTITGTVKKTFGGATETKAFPFPFEPYTSYALKIRFDQEVTTFEVDGVPLAMLNVVTSYVPVFDFTVETKNMNAFFDDIKLEAVP